MSIPVKARRSWTAIGLLAALVVVGLAARGTDLRAEEADAATLSDDRPNIVVVMTDDQTAGKEVRIMKRVRRNLGRRGVTFRNFFASFPLCCPSRATYLSGRYAHNHGVLSNRPSKGGGFPAFDGSQSAAVAMQDAGYTVGYIGKFLNGYAAAAHEDPGLIPEGFDHWFALLSGRYFNWEADDQGVIEDFRGPSKYQTDVYRRETVRFIDRAARADAPFWLTVAPFAPHKENGRSTYPNPRPAPRDRPAFERFEEGWRPGSPAFNEADVSDKPEFLRRPRLRRAARHEIRKRAASRRASLLAVDDLVGGLVKTLRANRMLRDTWVIFTSDNGYLFGEHRRIGKSLLYEGSARVPLIIRGPANTGFPGGIVRRQVTANVDLAPTILDIAGVEPLIEPDGTSLLPAGFDADAGSERDVLLENQNGSVAVRTSGWMYAEHDPDRDGDSDAFELYDMDRDPHQLENLYERSVGPGADPDLALVRTQLAARLAALRDCAGHGPPLPCD